MTQLLAWIGTPGDSTPPDKIREHAAKLGYRPHISVGRGKGLDRQTGEVRIGSALNHIKNEIHKHYEPDDIFAWDGPIEEDFEIYWRWVIKDAGPIAGLEFCRRVRELHDELRRTWPNAKPFSYSQPFYRRPDVDPFSENNWLAMREVAANCLLGHCAAYLRPNRLTEDGVTDEYVARLEHRMDGIASIRRPAFVHISPWAWNAPGWFVKPITTEQWKASIEVLERYRPAYICYWMNFIKGRFTQRVDWTGYNTANTHDLERYTRDTLTVLTEAVKAWEDE